MPRLHFIFHSIVMTKEMIQVFIMMIDLVYRDQGRIVICGNERVEQSD
ncbi:MAG: hypothetical protein V1857_01135 [archaeon]